VRTKHRPASTVNATVTALLSLSLSFSLFVSCSMQAHVDPQDTMWLSAVMVASPMLFVSAPRSARPTNGERGGFLLLW
jgi:hypothetical protein